MPFVISSPERAWLLVLLLLLGGCAEHPAPLPRLAPGATVLAFGDSITYGTGARRDQSYPAILSGLIGHKVVNAGIPGELSGDGLRRLPGALDHYRPALLILCHGGNDLLRKRPISQTKANLRAMVAQARDRGVPIILIGVPRPGLLLSAARIYPHLADELGLTYDGEVLPRILGDNGLKSDLVHPNAEGYRRLAEAIARLMRQAGALQDAG